MLGMIACSSLATSSSHVNLHVVTYLCYPPNVLIPVLLGEAQVFVEAEAHIVAVETVRSESKVQKMLLKSCRNGGFAGCGEAGKPDGEALLLAESVALSTGKRWVPGNVAGEKCQ